MVWGFCYLRIFKKMHSISGRRYRRQLYAFCSLPIEIKTGT
jgi:hypothetical protein